MNASLKLAFPTMGEPDLRSRRSGHFGHADCFTIVDIVDGEIRQVSGLDNPPHERGGCLRPVSLLQEAGVDAIVADGMGMRPLMGFANAGIAVYYEAETPEVGAAAERIARGDAQLMTPEHACQH